MTEETPGTRTDPATGTEGDTNQLPKEDTLLERGVDDLLDEDYSPPDRPRTNRFGETQLEEAQGESLDQRLAEERPEAWEEPDSQARQLDRAGRIEADPDAAQGKENDIYTHDDGVAGGAAAAEEAAMRVIDEEAD